MVPNIHNFTSEDYSLYESERKYFLSDLTERNYTFFDWFFSKGTSFDCYVEAMKKQTYEDKFNNNINIVRTILLGISRPFSIVYFFWTMLVFLFHGFNLKKPVMKIILLHFVLRATGNMVDMLGNLYSNYYALSYDSQTDTYSCINNGTNEYFPAKFFFKRYIATILWYTGEIVGDWYLLLRTKDVVKNENKIKIVKLSCAFYNLSKVLLILYHFRYKINVH